MSYLVESNGRDEISSYLLYDIHLYIIIITYKYMVERVSSSHKKNLKFIDLSETLEHVLNLTSLTLNL